MISFKKKLNSVRIKLFLILCTVVVIIVLFLILVNNVVLEAFYLYTKKNSLKSIYEDINTYYNNPNSSIDLKLELERLALNNNYDILIKTDENINIYTSDRNFLSTLNEINLISNMSNIGKEDILYENDKMNIINFSDSNSGVSFILLISELDNGYILYIRMPIASIQESVKISNKFLYLMGGFTIIVAGIMVSFISKRFTEPILELNTIAKKMSDLDFSQKYRITDTENEINDLGKSINTMSDKLEKTIKKLKNTNIELEKDIEEKSKIDEMRKQFISDVSHELKTPISLIQGYAEGLVENVNKDEESKKFYTEVILDEVNKMDKLVKQLLELMKLEYGKREFNNEKFNINELISEVIRKSQVMLEENKIKVRFKNKDSIFVLADEFYIEQVVTNYITNAIKHAQEINGKKLIKISSSIDIKKNKVRISVFNTGKNIKEENLNRIWKRFFKEDVSRNREDGGTGVGLALVKAIMNNYKNEYGVYNKQNGVEFYFELDLATEK